jgi:hypothetical protein
VQSSKKIVSGAFWHGEMHGHQQEEQGGQWQRFQNRPCLGYGRSDNLVFEFVNTDFVRGDVLSLLNKMHPPRAPSKASKSTSTVHVERTYVVNII